MKTLAKYDPIFLLILLTGVTGILLLYINQGIGLTDDSGFYVYAGCYEFMMEPTGKSLTIFPPLYPTLLALIHYGTSLSPLNAAAVLNLIAYLFFAWGIWLSGRDHFETSLYKYLFYTITLLGMPILFNAYMLWSEMLFITFLWFCLRFFYNFILRGNSKDLLYFSILFLFCFLTRYAALGILPGIYLLLLLKFKRNNIKTYLIALVFTIILPGLWLLRNQLVNTDAPYDKAILSFTDNLLMNTEVFSHFILADNIPNITGSLSIIFVLIYLSLTTWQDKQDQVRRLHLAVIISYTLFLIILNSIKNIQIPDERYYSILYPGFFLVFFISIEKRQAITSALFQKIIAGIIILWFVYPLARTYKNTVDFIKGGIGYQGEEWRNNALIKKVQSINRQLISNNPLPIILMGERAATTHTVTTKDAEDSLYMLWWNTEGLSYLPSDKGEWIKYYNFVQIDSTAQGQLFRLNKK